MTKNTIQHGSVRNVIFEENGEWFGAALEFNIVETGDSPQEVMVLLDEAVRGYVESAQKANLSDSVLNQEVDPEYEALWNKNSSEGYEHGEKKLYSASSQPLAAFAFA